MNTKVTHIIKRDGVQEQFTPKFENAVLKRYIATGFPPTASRQSSSSKRNRENQGLSP